jgi:hypothetical protein
VFKGPGPGRPKGGLNKSTIEARDLARAIVDDPEYRRLLILRVQQGEAPQMEILLWQYAYGKPKETIEIVDPNSALAGIRSVIVDVEPVADDKVRRLTPNNDSEVVN